MADVSQIVLKDANGNVIGTYDVKDASVPHDSKAATSGGTTLSLVTTGEKYNWDNKSISNLKDNTISNATNYDRLTYSNGKWVNENSVWVRNGKNIVILNAGSKSVLSAYNSNGGRISIYNNTPTETIALTGSNGNIKATTFNGYTLAGACSYGVTTSVASGNGNLVTSGGVYSAFTSRIKNSSSNRYFTSKTTMSYTGLSLTCPTGHVYIVQAWFRYANGAPRRVGACHLNNVFAFYDTVAASLDAQDCGNASLTFRMHPGETVYYWAMYYNATQNFITENILDITL